MYSMGLTHQPRNHQRWFVPRKKISHSRLNKDHPFICSGKSRMGNHQRPGTMPVTTTGFSLVSIWLAYKNTCAGHSVPHGCSFPAQGCLHPSVQHSCGQVSKTTTAGHTPKGIQTDTRVCGIAGGMLQRWMPKQETKAKVWTKVGHSQLQALHRDNQLLGPHEGVEDEIMNIKGPDKHHTTQCYGKSRGNSS